MGVYSKVYFSTTKDGYDRLYAMCSKDAEENKDIAYPFLGSGTDPEVHMDYKRGDEHYIVFGWDCVKWYPSFPEVKSVMDNANELRQDDVPFEHIEICEGSVEENWGYDSRLSQHIELIVDVNVWQE